MKNFNQLVSLTNSHIVKANSIKLYNNDSIIDVGTKLSELENSIRTKQYILEDIGSVEGRSLLHSSTQISKLLPHSTIAISKHTDLMDEFYGNMKISVSDDYQSFISNKQDPLLSIGAPEGRSLLHSTTEISKLYPDTTLSISKISDLQDEFYGGDQVEH